METAPRLSVTVLNYNYGHYLGECLRSILAQSMTDFELILINDCSTDNSRDIIAAFLSDPRIRLVDHETNQGYVMDGPDEFRRLLLSSPILHSGAMIPRWAYDAVGGYDSDCRYSVDTNMWLALCAVGKIAYLNTPLYAFRAHRSNLSQSAGSLWRATEEMLFGIDRAFARFPSGTIPGDAVLRRQARQRALVAIPTLDIFAGRLWRGWQGYGRALRRYPLLTLMQVRTLALLLRTPLGAQFYQLLTNCLRPKMRDRTDDTGNLCLAPRRHSSGASWMKPATCCFSRRSADWGRYSSMGRGPRSASR